MQTKCPRCGYEKESESKAGKARCPKCFKTYVFSNERLTAFMKIRREINPKIRKDATKRTLAWRNRNLAKVQQIERDRYQASAQKLKEYFGNYCFTCHKERKTERFELHEKLGNNHRKKPWVEFAEKERFVLLCKTCHRSVHWCMTYLDMSWEQISLNLRTRRNC
jgi:hypothetical protein